MIFLDSPSPWGLWFQDGSNPMFWGIEELHNEIFFYLILILIFVTWFLIVSAFLTHTTKHIAYKYNNHGTLIELIWTITPALMLLMIAIPSFKSLYLMDEIINPSITMKAIGKQWYWTYEYPQGNTSMEFDSFMVDTDELELGQLSLYEVDNSIFIPIDTNISLMVTSSDVIHSFGVPSLGLKIDAMPGSLNQVSLFSNSMGTFYGSCSELCGANHAFMPMVISAVSLNDYINWLELNA